MVCAKVVRRRAEGDEPGVEVRFTTLVGMLRALADPDAEVAARTG